MKPITGSVVSSKPVSLSKAAKIISRFAASDTGAHQDVSAFLRRTSEAFDELASFQKELRARGQAHGRKDGEKVKRKKEKPAVLKAVQDEKFIGIESCRMKKEEAMVETVQAGNFAATEVKRRKKEGAIVEVAQDGSFAASESKRKKTEKKEEVRTEAAQDGNFAEIEGELGTSARGFGEGILEPRESKSGSREKKRAAKEIEGRLGNVVQVETVKSSKTQVKKYKVVKEEREEDAENQSKRQRKEKRKMEQDVKGENGGVVGNHDECHHKKKRKIKEES